uniref:Ig-like domain-containing protein n=1 Tax=Fundulus heteroclitus TaxID=8078 RepID=A0A3Q2QKP1_FUNHE
INIQPIWPLACSKLVFLALVEPHVNCSTPTNAKRGRDAVLLCHLEPQSDARKYTIEWKFKNLIPHVYRSGKDDVHSADSNYKGRTSLINVEKGNISLKLLNATKADEGNYTCYVQQLPRQFRKCNVTLNVGELH